MKIAKLLVLSILSIVLIGLVNATLGVNETQLRMTVDAKVDGKSAGSDMADGEEITRDAKPESTLKITVNLENLYDKVSQNFDIEDIALTATLVGIDDKGDSDIELEADVSRIRPEGTSKKSFTFNIPLIVDEGSYDLTIDADFDDTNRNATIKSQSLTLTLNVNKETHKLVINKAELSKNNLVCAASTSLSVEMLNLGQDDEDKAVLEVTSDELNINVKDNVELNAGIDDDSLYSKKVTINTKDLKAGTYPITIKAYRNADQLEDTKSVELTVLECKKVEEKPVEKPIVVSICGNNVVETGEECDDGNKVNGDGCSSLCRIEQITPNVPVTPVTIEENFWDQYGTTVMIIAGEVIFLFVILIIVAVALRKK